MTWLPFVTAGLITGCIVAGFNRYRTRLKKWLFPKWKAKSEINLENKLEEQRIMLEKKYQKELFLNATPEVKQERLLNGFQEIWNKNKSKNFATIRTELSEKFEKNKQKLQKQEFARDYSQKINESNKNWSEKAEFSRSLAPEHIAEIKETFDETEKNKKIMCDGFFINQNNYEHHFKKNKFWKVFKIYLKILKKMIILKVKKIWKRNHQLKL